MFLPTIIILVVLIFFIWSLYNGLIGKKFRVDEAASQIDVQLKRRADLIPNLVETVKGYAKHEKTVFEEVTKARAALVSAGNLKDKDQANNQLAGALKSLFAVAESYPELKASENFKSLQEELTDTEDKVAYSRQFYNTMVLDYNTNLKVFPSVLFAKALNFQPAEFFGNIDPKDRQAIKVSF